MIEDRFFSPSFGRRPSVLVGREKVVSTFTDGLKGLRGNKDRAMLLMGQRGSGKTVLLLELAEIARNHDFVVAMPTIVAPGMLDQIIEKIQFEGSKLYKTKKKVTGGGIGILGISANLSFTPEEQTERSASYKLMRLSEELEKHNKGILILVDEVQASNEDLRKLIITYQEMVGADRNVAMVLAGLPGTISSVLNDKVLTFLHRARKIMLEDLSYGDIDAFLADAFQQMGISIKPEARLDAAKAAEGSPYYMQLIGHYITQYADDKGNVSKDALGQALERAKEDYKEGVCIAVADALTDTERRFIAAMNTTDTQMQTVVQKMQVRSDLANNYRRRLLDAGIIESPRRGVIRCVVPMLVEYLNENEVYR